MIRALGAAAAMATGVFLVARYVDAAQNGWLAWLGGGLIGLASAWLAER